MADGDNGGGWAAYLAAFTIDRTPRLPPKATVGVTSLQKTCTSEFAFDYIRTNGVFPT